jgi:fatty-acyl-CoA synthase
MGPPLEGVPGIGALTMGAFLEEVAERFGPNEALVFDDPLRDGATVRWTYDDLRAESRRIGRALLALGVERGEAVGILMGNRPEAVAALFGAAMTGAVAVPMSTFAPRLELAHMLDQAAITITLTQTRLLSRAFGDDLEALQADLPDLRHVAVLGEPTWDALLALADDVTDRELDARIAGTRHDDPALVIFSSGTTSLPKGVLHGHRAPSLQFWLQAQIFGRHEATRMWTSLPVFWTAGLNTAMGSTLASGGCWVVQEVFEPGAALALIARERVTEPYTLPHQTAALEEHPDWAATDLSSLRCVFGKSAFARHPSVAGDPEWLMPVGYGLSETCAFFASHWSTAEREATKRSVGPLLPGNRLRVIDPDTGAVLGVDEEGELALAGPTVMQRYLGKAPEECFDADGFFRTGDAGHVDARGELHFSGRRTEMIKTGGANVSPAELEVQLRACPAVKLSRIVGVPDDRLDELVVACITLKEGADATAEDIQSFLRERVAAYKVPKRVLFFADGEIPMTGSDTKVRDDALVALVQDRLATTPVPTTTGDR